LQDAKNLSWKLAAVIKKQASFSLLSSFEEERRNIDAKITKAVETGTTAFSARNPLVFFLRGRGQRVIGATVSMVPEAAKTARGWSYSGSPLAYEHWERPSVMNTFKDILRGPTKVYRRRQNFYRWSSEVGARICAGDPVPPVMVDFDSLRQNLYDVIKSSSGWTLLMFEGNPLANLESHKNGLPIWSDTQMLQMGQELKQLPDRDGYTGFIDKVIIFPSSDVEAHETFGVLAQCLFLVRPDTYVGLRSEPVRKGSVTRYLASIGAVDVPPHNDCPQGSSTTDPFPLAILVVILLIICAATWSS